EFGSSSLHSLSQEHLPFFMLVEGGGMSIFKAEPPRTKSPWFLLRRSLVPIGQLTSGFLAPFGQLSSPFFGVDKHIIGVSKFFFPRLPDFAIAAPVVKLGAVQDLQ